MSPSTSWLASFPKSGSTWLRFVIAHLCGHPAETSADLAGRLPSALDPPLASQAPWRATNRTFPAHARRLGPQLGRLVHLVRHPADALLSSARFFCLTQADQLADPSGHIDPERLEHLLRQYLSLVLERGDAHQHERLGLASWAGHTESWLARHDAQPTLLVRYEDLRRSPVAQLQRLARFVGQPIGSAKAHEIAGRYDLKRLRHQQEHEIDQRIQGAFYLGPAHERAYQLGLRALGRGRVGDGLQIGSTALRRMWDQFGPTMRQLGYTTDPDRPVVDVAPQAGAA